jgi:predicted N-acetyltransferase YhbS
MGEVIIRNERKADYRASEEVTRDAFWNNHHPGCDEHYLLNLMRSHPDFIHELDFVAEVDGRIVGHIGYTKSSIIPVDGSSAPINTVTFGPISVAPDFQRQGIGRKLIEHSAKVAKELGYSAIMIYGDVRFYGRVGFRWAERYDIKTPTGRYSASLLIYVLQEEAVARFRGLSDNGGGTCHESSIFETDLESGFDAFYATFSYRAKEEGTKSQLEFNVLKSIGYPAK